MATLTCNESANISGTKFIDSRCVVDFRPNNDWKGEYGFDWFRIGDTEERFENASRATDYKTLVGKYAPQDPDYGDSAGTLSRRAGGVDHAEELAKEYPRLSLRGLSDREQYLIPYLSLYFMSTAKWTEGEPRTLPREMVRKKDDEYVQRGFCKTKAIVNVLINAKNISHIRFACEDSLTVKPNLISNVPDGKSTQKITIQYNYPFTSGHQAVKAFAYHKDGVTKTFAGQINVVKCEPKKVNVCFVNVKLQINRSISSGIPDNDFIATHKKNLRRFLSQAHVLPQFTTANLDMSQQDMSNNLSTRTISRNGRQYNINVVLKYSANNHDTDGNILERHFNKKYPRLANSYKIFFFGEYGLSVTSSGEKYLGGHANGIPSKGLVIYKKPTESVVSHEIMHCFGLYHSFSNKGKHTFKKKETNNIMDYSSGCISLLRWQWNLIRKASGLRNVLKKNGKHR